MLREVLGVIMLVHTNSRTEGDDQVLTLFADFEILFYVLFFGSYGPVSLEVRHPFQTVKSSIRWTGSSETPSETR